jgi:hypothetical protein
MLYLPNARLIYYQYITHNSPYTSIRPGVWSFDTPCLHKNDIGKRFGLVAGGAWFGDVILMHILGESIAL